MTAETICSQALNGLTGTIPIVQNYCRRTCVPACWTTENLSSGRESRIAKSGFILNRNQADRGEFSRLRSSPTMPGFCRTDFCNQRVRRDLSPKSPALPWPKPANHGESREGCALPAAPVLKKRSGRRVAGELCHRVVEVATPHLLHPAAGYRHHLGSPS